MIPLEEFLKPTQNELLQHLHRMYRKDAVSRAGRFLLVQGEAPILLVAHLDTVHREPVKTICTSQNGNILMSPQGIGGDDRCGVYALVNAHDLAGKKPWLLFTCDEETGGDGARAFATRYEKGILPKALDGLRMILEVDRKGHRDAVYYDCANEDFEEYITSKGFQTELGSFSDISIIAPALGVAAVNLSSGYYNAHTLHEYINRKHIDAVIQKIGEIIADASKEDFPRYEYIDGGWGMGFGRYAYCKPPKDLPEDYRDVYDELLDYYGPDEVNGCFRAYGKGALCRMYEFVFGEGSLPHLPKIKRKETYLCPQPNLSALTGNVSP